MIWPDRDVFHASRRVEEIHIKWVPQTLGSLKFNSEACSLGTLRWLCIRRVFQDHKAR